jgi:Domain of unknown function (DUF6371)
VLVTVAALYELRGIIIPKQLYGARLMSPSLLRKYLARLVKARLVERHTYRGRARLRLALAGLGVSMQYRCQHFGLGVANELLVRFALGTSAHWPGACIFWLLDEHEQVRGGQVVLYDETGNTVKSPRRCTTWVHTALANHCRQQNKPAPDWLANYVQHGQKSPCLFGLPQLMTAPVEKPIAIVKSAKTAIACTPYWPEFIWLVTMGQSYLTAERLAPMKGRRLTLFPDADSLDNWQQRAEKLRAQGFDAKVSTGLEYSVTAEERTMGLDLADVLLAEWPGYPPSWDN